ncbi:MAG: flavodoxin-dependent (E)-4-hydroxy-3-methylbut-2-enyl-diphosphate synthase [Ignavibacteria bacterium]|jgi:(E)-4-hydroxy-3-methylbut-2-enyl-diphosphate synthase|nr:flavodoxin-dependent (E)-4-hydroxy-3-methylbut-2-enyl-diphosphate synthase [Ignavibacteria bacterium]
MNINRKNTKNIRIGNLTIGSPNPIPIQTMTNTKTANATATLAQIAEAKNAGANIVRVTVNDEGAADALLEIVANAELPIVADIHFNHIFALKAIAAGVAKVRINPGNIGNEQRIRQVLDAAKERAIPIRIGVNSGSLEKDILEKYGAPTAEALVESALRHVAIANKFDFDDIVIAVKSSSVTTTIDAYRLLSEQTNYPLHLGVTEAGSVFAGTIKSTVAIATLLSEGIGDTIRVSLTGSPIAEVEAGIEILSALELRKKYVELVSCPTCGRVEVDLISIVQQLEPLLKPINKHLKLAVMGCVVNGPGEAKEADIAVACGKKEALLFIRGEQVSRIPESEIIPTILDTIDKF